MSLRRPVSNSVPGASSSTSRAARVPAAAGGGSRSGPGGVSTPPRSKPSETLVLHIRELIDEQKKGIDLLKDTKLAVESLKSHLVTALGEMQMQLEVNIQESESMRLSEKDELKGRHDDSMEVLMQIRDLPRITIQPSSTAEGGADIAKVPNIHSHCTYFFLLTLRFPFPTTNTEMEDSRGMSGNSSQPSNLILDAARSAYRNTETNSDIEKFLKAKITKDGKHSSTGLKVYSILSTAIGRAIVHIRNEMVRAFRASIPEESVLHVFNETKRKRLGDGTDSEIEVDDQEHIVRRKAADHVLIFW
ncbi:hypothetical protein FGB62_308g00 [Gracilaria domingensis]|nr:hypothetical protein FGB62_308g00 [Gracilaria domingensis]